MFEYNYITPKQASVFVGMSEETVKAAIYDSENPLPAFRAGSRILIKTQDFERWLKQKADRGLKRAMYEDVKMVLVEVIKLIIAEHGSYAGTCNELSEQVANAHGGLSLSPSSIGRLLNNMEELLDSNNIKVVKKRGSARVYYFFAIRDE